MKHQHLQFKLNGLKEKSHFRKARELECNGYNIAIGEKKILNFSSNDYLGLAGDLTLQTDFFKSAPQSRCKNWMASCSSRALTGTSPSHSLLENSIAMSYGKERALIFNSGYHVNTGILPAITSAEDLILSDKLIHASVIDGVRLGKATCIQFRHNDMNHLEQLLDDNQNKFRSIWILSESLFSMDGDYAPLTQLIALKKKYQAYLYLDEAHAVACIGENGLGLADQLGVIGDIDLLIGTFGKALAGYGGYVAGDRVLIETMENFSRSWIFSTSLPPITMDWNYFIWQQLRSLATLRTQLAATTQHFREGLHKLEQNIRGTSHIVPLLKPGNAQVIALAAKLEQAGILVLPIRSPTVASGSERLRFSLTAGMPIDKVQQCLGQIERAL